MANLWQERAGHAPKVYEIYHGDQLTQIIQSLNAGDKARIPETSSLMRYGILMEEIPWAYNFIRVQDVPGFVKSWSRQQLEDAIQRIRDLQASVTGLHVFTDDAQVFISPNGLIVLGDLDHFRYTRNADSSRDFNQLAQDLIHKWEQREYY